MPDYESSYYSARNSYYNACSQINSCQNRISELKAKKQRLINRINELKADIKKHEAAQKKLDKAIKEESTLTDSAANVSRKIAPVATGYSGMVDSSQTTAKDLSQIYGDEMTQVNQKITSAMQTLHSKSTALTQKIADLKQQLSTAESDLEEIKRQIRNAESELADWKCAKRNSSLNMEVNRKLMMQDY